MNVSKIFIVSILLMPAMALGCSNLYMTATLGYKLQEADYMMQNGKGVPVDEGHPVGTDLELGCQKGNLSYGLKHTSQAFDGWPFEKTYEYHNTQIFIRYRFDLNWFD